MNAEKSNLDANWALSGNLVLPRKLADSRLQELHRVEPKLTSEASKVSRIPQHEQPPAPVVWQNPFPEWNGPVLKVIHQEATEQACQLRLARGSNGEDQRRTKAMIDLLRMRGELRKLAPIPNDWTARLIRLEERFPNFKFVLDYVRIMYTLSVHGNRTARFAPMLLNGPPGCGKSMFADALANEIGSGFLKLHMENAQSNSALSGSSDFWSNSKPSERFNTLVEQDYANPVVCLDEIDKVRTRDYDPMSSLLSLFESGSARNFRDQSFPWITLDASRVIWICTSNDAEKLSTPILDRVRRFDIPPLTDRQARAIVMQIFDEVRKEMPASSGVSVIRLASKAVLILMELSPRRMRQTLREGTGRALLRRSKTILPCDLAVETSLNEEPRRIGFLP